MVSAQIVSTVIPYRNPAKSRSVNLRNTDIANTPAIPGGPKYPGISVKPLNAPVPKYVDTYKAILSSGSSFQNRLSILPNHGQQYLLLLEAKTFFQKWKQPKAFTRLENATATGRNPKWTVEEWKRHKNRNRVMYLSAGLILSSLIQGYDSLAFTTVNLKCVQEDPANTLHALRAGFEEVGIPFDYISVRVPEVEVRKKGGGTKLQQAHMHLLIGVRAQGPEIAVLDRYRRERRIRTRLHRNVYSVFAYNPKSLTVSKFASRYGYLNSKTNSGAVGASVSSSDTVSRVAQIIATKGYDGMAEIRQVIFDLVPQAV